MQKTQCFHWVFSFDAHRRSCRVHQRHTATSFSAAFFHSAHQHIHFRHRFSLCPLRKLGTGAHRRPEILMPCTSPHAACVQRRIKAERREQSSSTSKEGWAQTIKRAGVRSPWSVTWSKICCIDQRCVPPDWKPHPVTCLLTHHPSFPLCSSVPLCFKTHHSCTCALEGHYRGRS